MLAAAPPRTMMPRFVFMTFTPRAHAGWLLAPWSLAPTRFLGARSAVRQHSATLAKSSLARRVVFMDVFVGANLGRPGAAFRRLIEQRARTNGIRQEIDVTTRRLRSAFLRGLVDGRSFGDVPLVFVR